MKKNKFLATLIVKKTNSFFKFSIGLFIISLIMAASGMVFLWNQYMQWNNNFLKNSNVHIITVTSKMNGDDIKQLAFSDNDTIAGLIHDYAGAKVYCQYSIECGIPDESDNVYYVSTTTDESGDLLGIKDYNEEFAYCNDSEANNITLSVPVVEVTGGGFESREAVEYEIDGIKSIGKHAAIDLFNSSNDKELYVSTEKFKEIIEMMFQVNWDDFVQNYDNNNPYSMQVVKAYYVYMKNMDDIESCAEGLEDAGYNANYTIKAFDNISGVVNSSMLIIMLMIIMILIFSLVTMIMSFNSYYKMQQRDMGILKQMGYGDKDIYSIYSRILIRPFAIMIVIIMIYSSVLSVSMLKSLFYTMLTNLILIAVIGIVFGIVRVILLSYVKRDIIYLIKKSKEVE